MILVLFGDSFGLHYSMLAMTAGFLLTGGMVAADDVSAVKALLQKKYVATPKHIARSSFARIGNRLRSVKQQKEIFMFLLAFVAILMMYIPLLIWQQAMVQHWAWIQMVCF